MRVFDVAVLEMEQPMIFAPSSVIVQLTVLLVTAVTD